MREEDKGRGEEKWKRQVRGKRKGESSVYRIFNLILRCVRILVQVENNISHLTLVLLESPPKMQGLILLMQHPDFSIGRTDM